MRWKHPKYGDRRIRRKFLFFPLRIEGETRWLETASWLECGEYLGRRESLNNVKWTVAWTPKEWIDN